MSIAGGPRSGFEVVRLIGSGGMGKVYRARDLNLKRDVALKVLPADFANDTGRLARFQREAEVLASLNHPNIAQIYGIDRGDGGAALAMELVEGLTLAGRIAIGRIPVDEALRTAAQIVDALEAAHERGIVHRDLKPANIVLRPDGVAKVLDFGLAKALEPMSTQPGAEALTVSMLTEVGVVMGTAAYMSPEQARGRPVDQRTDIWAFGCVLYEMLTGQRAFRAEDAAGTLARVLEGDVNMKALPSSVPAPVRRTIELCLRKESRRRLRDIGDVRLALEGELVAPEPPRPRWQVLPLGAVSLILAALLVVGVFHLPDAAGAELGGSAAGGVSFLDSDDQCGAARVSRRTRSGNRARRPPDRLLRAGARHRSDPVACARTRRAGREAPAGNRGSWHRPWHHESILLG